MTRFIYSIKFDNGKSSTCLSVERIYDPLRYFRAKFGEDSVIEVYERTGDGKSIPSTLLPLSQEEEEAIAPRAT